MHKNNVIERYHYSLQQTQQILQNKQRTILEKDILIRDLQTEKKALVRSLQDEEKRGNKLRTTILNNHKKYLSNKMQMEGHFLNELFNLSEDKKHLEQQLASKTTITKTVVSNLIDVITPPTFYATPPDFSQKTCPICLKNFAQDEYAYYYSCCCQDHRLYHRSCVEDLVSTMWIWSCPVCREPMSTIMGTTYDLAIWASQQAKVEKFEVSTN